MQLFEFVETHREQIVRAWEADISKLPSARRPEPILRDSIPWLLERIARQDARHEPHEGQIGIAGGIHALQRLQAGFDLWTVATEYRVLRACILRLWIQHERPGDAVEQVMQLDDSIDEMLADAVAQYSQSRNRTLEALDRISTVALEEHDIDAFLRRLMSVFMQTVPSVQSAAILLRDQDDTLVLRAAVGFEADVRGNVRVRVGEGFAGAIAARNVPMTIRNVAQHPLPKSDTLRALDLQVLHGVPMHSDGSVIGVAHIGSREISDFSDEDRALFAAMVGRASSAVVQAKLRAREREARIQAEQAEERVVLANEAAQIGAWDLDMKSRVLHCDHRCKELFDVRDESDLRLETLVARVHPHDMLRIRVAVREAIETPNHHRVRIEFRVRRDGESADRWLEMHGRLFVGEGGRVTRLVGTLVDVTESHHTREELEREAAYRERFIAILSHDLRNPLSAVLFGASTLARQRGLSESASRIIERIQSAAGRATRMVSDLLDLTRIRQSGGLPIERTTVRLENIARQVVDELKTAHPERTIELRSSAVCEGEWDPDRLAQVVSNLVGNAIRHSPADAAVRTTITARADSAELSVHNDGSTIPPESLATIFDPFKSSGYASGARKGLGLGLYISREIVHAHGGTIEVDSGPERGTTFTVRLPRTPR